MEFISRNNNKRKSEPEEIDDKTAAVHGDTNLDWGMGEHNIIRSIHMLQIIGAYLVCIKFQRKFVLIAHSLWFMGTCFYLYNIFNLCFTFSLWKHIKFLQH